MQAIAAANNTEQHFANECQSTDLPYQSLRGGISTLLAQFFNVFLQALSVILLARLLTPADYGLFSIVISLTTLGRIFGDLGLSTAILQISQINHKQISTLFWLNMAQSLVIAAIAIAAAPFLGQFYREPRLPALLILMTLILPINALGYQQQALLKRQMRFAELAIVESISVLVGITVAIISAYLGAGFWALAYMQLLIVCVATMGFWIISSWRPRAPNLNAGIGPLLLFGRDITAFNILGFLNQYADNLLIGRYAGAAALGLYDKAFQLFLLPMQLICWPLSPVILASLSRLGNEPERFNHYARNMLLLTCGLCMPLIAFLFVKTQVIVLVVLGKRWLNLVPAFMAMAPAAFFESFLVCLGLILLASGKSGKMLAYRIVQSVITLIGFIIGIRWGIVGVALSLSITRMILLPPFLFYNCQNTGVSWNKIASAPLCSIVASILAAALLHLTDSFVRVPMTQTVHLLFDGMVFVVAYLSIWLCFPEAKLLLLRIGQALLVGDFTFTRLRAKWSKLDLSR